MNKKRLQICGSIFFVLLTCIFCVSLFAQPTVVTNPADGLTNTVITNATTVVQNLTPSPAVTSQSTGVALAMIVIPLLVPILVAIAKYFMPKLPGWTLPILASLLGAVIDFISSKLGGPGVGPLLGLILGAAGVGAREILDQLKQTKAAATGTAVGVLAFALLLFGSLVPLGMGCAGKLAPGGDYSPGTTSLSTNASTGVITTNFTATAAPDFAFFTADASFDLTYSAIDAIFNFERDNRNLLWSISPDIKHTLDKLRPQAVQIRNDYIAARIAYEANPIPANLTTLQDVLSRIKATLAAVQAAIPPTIKIQ